MKTFWGGLMMMVGAVAMAAPQETHVGVVDVQAVIAHSAKVKSLNNHLKSQFEAEHDALMKAQKTLHQRVQKFHKDEAVMPQDKRDQFKQEMTKEEHALSRKQLAFSQKVMAEQERAMHDVIKELKAVVAKAAQQAGMNVVLVRNSAVYVDPQLDLTETVQHQFK